MPSQHIEITDSVLVKIGSFADELGVEAYLVGGYVRDKFLGRECKDIDIVVVGDGIVFAQAIANAFGRKDIVVYEKFGTAMFPYDGGKIEFVTAREESYESGSRKPNVKKASLESDLARRDFTINTLAASLNKGRFGEVNNMFDGYADLKQKIIRTPLAPEKT